MSRRARRHQPLLLLGAVVALLLAWSPPALADRIETLSGALLGDPSWRVKVQAAITLGKLKARDPRAINALVEALRDANEAVRAVAVETLGKLGDRSALDACRTAASDGSAGVRAQAKKAVALLEKTGAATGGSAPLAAGAHWYLEISEFAPGKADAETARKVREVAVRELGRMAGVTLDAAAPGATARYWVDANITALTAGKPDENGRVHTDCGVRLVLASLPEKSIRMMATLESSVEGSTDPRDLEGARADCLVDAARQIAEKVGSYLESHR